MDFETLRTKLREAHGPDFDFGLVERAYRLAEERNPDELPRSLAVALRLADWRLDAATLAAALLHSAASGVAESVPYPKRDVEKRFGSEVAFLLGALTKLNTIRYADGAERTENLRRMVLSFAEDIRVMLIQLTDRLQRLETISSLEPALQLRIARETIEIYAPIASRLGIGELKGQLEDLAFPVVYPEEWRSLRERVAEPREARLAYVQRIIPLIRERLAGEGITPTDIHTRAKHWYSLWKKLERHDRDLDRVHDLVAVRIIVNSLESCYAALGAIHGSFPPLPGRIKDYIATPKANGYRSLHTTVFGPEGKVTEIQIRTPDMHGEAEGGIAAHWAYSEERARARRGPAFSHSRDIAWIRQLREWQTHFQESGEFIESLKLDFFKDRIFVFTPKGEVIDLPEGATPVDFAYHIHSRIGDQAVGAKVDGKMVALDSELANGDIVEILVQKNKKPSRDWLGFVKTSVARGHIRSALKNRIGSSS